MSYRIFPCEDADEAILGTGYFTLVLSPPERPDIHHLCLLLEWISFSKNF